MEDIIFLKDLSALFIFLIELETQKKKERALAELAWISEYKDVQLRKLKKKYFEDVAVERIVLRGFKVRIFREISSDIFSF